jgi:hypothetical protein
MSPINPQNTSFYKKNNNKLVAGNKVKQYPWKRERFINIIFIFTILYLNIIMPEILVFESAHLLEEPLCLI